jgi:hypothetical protein
MSRAVVAAGSAVTAVVCAATGFGYQDFGQEIGFEPSVAGWFITLGLLGAATLVALGLGQWVAGPRTRVFLLVVLGFVCAGYVAANAFGLYVFGSAGDLEVPSGLHRAGMWLGSILFLGVLLEAMRVIQTQRSLEERPG